MLGSVSWMVEAMRMRASSSRSSMVLKGRAESCIWRDVALTVERLSSSREYDSQMARLIRVRISCLGTIDEGIVLCADLAKNRAML